MTGLLLSLLQWTIDIEWAEIVGISSYAVLVKFESPPMRISLVSSSHWLLFPWSSTNSLPTKIQFSMRLISTSVSSFVLPWMAHSQTIISRQSRFIRQLLFFISRTWFFVIFWFQKSTLDLGCLYKWQLCPCQKQPLIWMTALYFGSTKSGEPGSSLQWVRYRKPRLCKAFRTISSGLVSLLWMQDITWLRALEDILSIGDSENTCCTSGFCFYSILCAPLTLSCHRKVCFYKKWCLWKVSKICP